MMDQDEEDEEGEEDHTSDLTWPVVALPFVLRGRTSTIRNSPTHITHEVSETIYIHVYSYIVLCNKEKCKKKL